VLLLIAAASCASAADPAPIEGIGPTGEIVRLHTGFKFTEGPAADGQGNVYFMDIPNNRIHRVDLDGKLTTVLEDSQACNGLMFDGRGRLLACQGRAKRVIAIDVASGGIAVVADQYAGQALKVVPNDLVIDRSGGVYFTDPDARSVFYASGTGAVERLIDDLPRPNGVLLSPDEKTLYVLPSGSADVQAYPVEAPGKIGAGKTFCKLLPNPDQPSRPGGDGLTVDTQGNLYLTRPSLKLIQVVSPKGATLGTIRLPEEPANCTFGGKDLKTLYVTAQTSLYAVPLETTGHRFGSDGVKPLNE
jgi:gluconolactonase